MSSYDRMSFMNEEGKDLMVGEEKKPGGTIDTSRASHWLEKGKKEAPEEPSVEEIIWPDELGCVSVVSRKVMSFQEATENKLGSASGDREDRLNRSLEIAGFKYQLLWNLRHHFEEQIDAELFPGREEDLSEVQRHQLDGKMREISPNQFADELEQWTRDWDSGDIETKREREEEDDLIDIAVGELIADFADEQVRLDQREKNLKSEER